MTDKKDKRVEEIMRRVRERIRRRGLYVPEAPRDETDITPLDRDIRNLPSKADTRSERIITSHRKIVGPSLVKTRKFLHEEIIRATWPMASKQIDFNRSVANAVLGLQKKINMVESRNRKMINLSERFDGLTSKLDKSSVPQIALSNFDRLGNIIKKEDEISAKKQTNNEKIMSNHDYFIFENRYRGPEKIIKEKHKKYIKYFKGGKDILDIGCGRGEFLELLKENKIKAKGIDINNYMCTRCRKKGLDAENVDVITYLNRLKDNSLGGIFISHVIEHMPPTELVELTKLAYKKMRPGWFIAETPNHLCLYSLVNSHIDMSHKRLIHAETMRFLLETTGFKDITFEFSSEVSKNIRLEELNPKKQQSRLDKILHKNGRISNLETINRNTKKINDFLFGDQDYVVFARKIR